MNGYIKLHRKLIEWEWYSDMKVSRVFIHLLLLASFKDTNWRGQGIKRGQVITSYPSLSKQLGLSVQEIRTTFKKLASTHDINSKATGRNLLVTLVKFDAYQSNEIPEQQDSNAESTAKQQDSNTESTGLQQHRNNVKNVKKDKKDKKEHIYLAEFQKIKNRETTSRTNLDKNFHFGLFDDSWTDNFKNEILGMWRYLESKEHKPEYWGNIGTLTTQLGVLRSMLNDYSEQQIIQSFVDCKFASKKSWNMYLKNAKEQIVPSNYTPPYNIPDFGGDKEKRHQYFYWRLTEYRTAGDLDEGLWNTKYKPRGLYKKDAETLCYELEQQNLELAKIELG